jgi:hypothetical protein
MANTTIEALDEASRKLTARIERITDEALTVAQERADAVVKATEAQYKAGLELVEKSRKTLKDLAEGELPEKARHLVEHAVETARKSADTWIEFAQDSLGSVRRVLKAAVEQDKAA